MNRSRSNRGAVLLLMLMVLAILIVVVGQFAHTVVLDRMVALNVERDVQLHLDVEAGLEAAAAVIGSENGTPGDFQIERADPESEDGAGTTISVALSDESGKFNVNALRTPPAGVSAQTAEAAFRRLLEEVAAEGAGITPQAVDQMVTGIRSGERPLPTLAVALGPEGGDPANLWGGDDGEGLSAYFTVHGDGRVRPGAGDEKVLTALVPGLTAKNLDTVLAYARNPKAKPPGALAPLVEQLRPWLATRSDYFCAMVRVRRHDATRRVRAILVKSDGDASVTRYDEIE